MLEDAHSPEMVLQMLYAVHSKDRENDGMASGFGGERGIADVGTITVIVERP